MRLAGVVRVLAVGYAIVGVGAILLMVTRLHQDSLAAAPAVLVGMPWALGLGWLPDGVAPWHGAAAAGLCIGINLLILSAIASWLGRHRRW